MIKSTLISFDERIHENAGITALKHPIIRDYLYESNNPMYESSSEMSVEELAGNLHITGGIKEEIRPKNVGLLMFNEQPENFFPNTRIEIVNIPHLAGYKMEDRIFNGPVHQQLLDVLCYIKNNVIAARVYKVVGQAESERFFNYSYEAIEAFLSNAVYHKSYQIHKPITVRIQKDRIEITSNPGPDTSISDKDIKQYAMHSTLCRNKRIGEFLKKLNLIEGNNRGIKTAIQAIETNGSPLPMFLTDSERSFFSVVLKIHPKFE